MQIDCVQRVVFNLDRASAETCPGHKFQQQTPKVIFFQWSIYCDQVTN